MSFLTLPHVSWCVASQPSPPAAAKNTLDKFQIIKLIEVTPNHGLSGESVSRVVEVTNFQLAVGENLVAKLRLWQMEINEELKKKRFKVPVHLGLGTEALVAAVSLIVRDSDSLLLTHRNAAYNLARATDPRDVVREYELSREGTAFGQLGSMNLSNPESGVVYSSSILGNNISVACGFAFGQKISGSNSITVVLTGDGALEEGAFYEGLVFAKSHDLPLILVVDNNDYSMASAISQRRCNINLELFCKSIGIDYLMLVGNDVNFYVKELEKASGRLRTNSSPMVVEVHTTLLNQHAGPTPGWPTDPMQVHLSSGLVIAEDVSDPVFVLKEKYGETTFSNIESKVFSESLRLDKK